MTVPYRIVIVHKHRDAFARKISEPVESLKQELFGEREILEISSALSEESIPQSVAYLCGMEHYDDDHIKSLLDFAVSRQIPILPIVEEKSDSLEKYLPKSIQYVNAVNWSADNTTVARILLESLGLVEKERRLFISYRQSDSRFIADQLHTKLVRGRFDVFLDRFSVAPGADFTKSIDNELGDKAFLLLIESKHANDSIWVRHEITYALANRIQVFALTLPDVPASHQIQNLDEAFRFRITANDFTSDGLLTDAILNAVIDKIEIEHARAIYRRREQIMGSVMEHLHSQGCICYQIEDWSVLALKSNEHAGVFLITPRHPKPVDFYSLNLQIQKLIGFSGTTVLKASVVHASTPMYHDQWDVVKWISRISGSSLSKIEDCYV